MKFAIADFDMIARDPDAVHHVWDTPANLERIAYDVGAEPPTIGDCGHDMLELRDVVFPFGGGAVWKNYWIHGASIHYFPVVWASADWRPGNPDASNTYIDIEPKVLMPTKTIDGPALYCDSTVGPSNFGHFVHDFLPYGEIFLKLQRLYPALAPLIRPMRLPNQLRLIEGVFGLRSDEFVEMGAVSEVKRLFLVRRQTVFQGKNWTTSFSGLRAARERALAGMKIRAPDRLSRIDRPLKIALHRRRAADATRFANIPALLAALADIGYITLEPSLIPLETLAGLLARAESVVGVQGQNMANIMFCPRGASVVEIHPAGGYWPNWAAVAAVLGLQYQPASQRPAATGEAPSIDIENLLALLLRHQQQDVCLPN